MLLLLILSAAPAELPPHAGDDVLFRALNDEMTRSLERLRLEEHGPPYFVSFAVEDVQSNTVAASFGAVVSRNEWRNRLLVVDLRVGTRELDQTNFLGDPRSFRSMAPGRRETSLPLDEDYDAIRNAVWKTVDGAYKDALEAFSKKRSVLKTRNIEELLPDLAEDESFVLVTTPLPTRTDENLWTKRVRSLSAIFRDHPGIQSSRVAWSDLQGSRTYLDSDGFCHRVPIGYSRLVVNASTQAEDGTRLDDWEDFVARSAGDLPPLEEVEAAARAMASDLEARRSAETPESYLGPVLFEGRAAADLWRTLIRRHAANPRSPLYEQPWLEQIMPGSRFRGQVGRRVAGERATVVDDPTLEEWAGKRLLGHYRVDEQGVPPQKVTVVEGGSLAGFFLDRTPAEGFEGSNGHALGGGRGSRPRGKPAVLMVSSEKAMSEEELREEFLEAVQDEGLDYGLVVRTLSSGESADPYAWARAMQGGQTPSELPDPFRVYRLDVKDGKETPVRGLGFVGVDVGILRDILAIGEKQQLYEFVDRGPTIMGSMPIGGWSGLSVITSGVAVEEVELRKPQTEPERLPLLPHPYFAQQEAKKE
jgi:hypothetical protein